MIKKSRLKIQLRKMRYLNSLFLQIDSAFGKMANWLGYELTDHFLKALNIKRNPSGGYD